MKRTICLLALFSLAAARSTAALEPVGLDSENVMPQFPVSLQVEAVRSGRVELAVDVSPEGRTTDLLVLGYTHAELIAPCTEAVQAWHFLPAKMDGHAVPAHIEFTIYFTTDGIIVSSNMAEEIFERDLRHEGERLVYRTRHASALDHVPARVAGAAPKYATAALKQGVRGAVRVRFYIDESGAVRMPAVDADAQPYLAAKALEAVRDWKFEPPTSKGQPVLVAASEEFNFGRAE